MDPEAFTKALCQAFTDPKVRSSLGEIVSDSVRNEINSLRVEIRKKDAYIDELRRKMIGLESANDSLEQYSRRNSLRIAGMPEHDGEDLLSVSLKMINEDMSVMPPITEQDIDRIHRIGKRDSKKPLTMTTTTVASDEDTAEEALTASATASATASTTSIGRPRSIIIKLSTYRARYRIMKNRRNLKDTNIFMNEDLTKERSSMLYKARMTKRHGHIKDCWTHDGAIVVKDNKGKISSARSLIDAQDLLDSFIPLGNTPPY